MSIETAALGAGKAVAEFVAKKWLGWRETEQERSADLIDLMQVGFRDQLLRRKTTRQFEALADSVSERLLPLLEHEFRGLDEGTRAAVARQVARTLDDTDLSDKAFLSDDADPVRLARRIRGIFPASRAEREFGDAGARLYEILLDECCDCLAHILVHLPPFTARAAAESLARLSSTVSMLETVLSRLPARTLEAPEGKSLDQDFTQRYLKTVSESLDQLELHGVGFERFKRPRATLSVAYISLSVTDESEQKERLPGPLRIDEWRSERREPGSVRAERALGDRRRILIRGEAGGGKTTLLRWLAVTAARGAFTGELEALNGCVPFVIKLRSHADRGLPGPQEFLDDVAPALSGLMPKAWAHRQLSSGRALVLVDGIDEITEDRRADTRDWLADLTRQFPEVRVVVTSRPAAAEVDWLRAEGFGTVFLEQLGPADLRAFIRQWHTAVRGHEGLPCAPERLPSYEAKLLSRLESSPSLRNLASSPLLAAMLCALNLDREDALPRNRMSLYSQAVTLLTDTRDAARGVPSARTVSLDSGDKVLLLENLAWHLQSNDLLEVPRATARRLISERLAAMPQVHARPAAVLDTLLERSGVLQEPAKDRISFVHRTLQEYLAAGRAAELGDMGMLVGKAHRSQWRETVLMAAGRVNEPLREELVSGIAARARAEREYSTRLRRLIVSCWETLPSIPPSIRGIIDECVASLIPPNNGSEARALATAGTDVLTRLPATLDGLTDFQAAGCARTAWLVNGPEALRLLQRYAADQRPAVEWEISQAWDYFDSDEYVAQVLTWRPPGSGLSIANSPGRVTALGQLPPLSRLQVTMPTAGDFRFLSSHAGSLRFLYVNILAPLDYLDEMPEFPRLEELSIGAPGLSDLSFLRSLPQLSGVWLTTCENIRDYSPLKNSATLRTLGLIGARLDRGTLECLVEAAPELAVLALKDCRWDSGLEPLASLAQLRHLQIAGPTPGVDLSPLAGNSLLRVHIDAQQSIRGKELLGDRLMIEN